MSGGHFNFAGFTIQDVLVSVAHDAAVCRRWPELAELLVLIGIWFRRLEHDADWAISGDRAIADDALWEREQITILLEQVMIVSPADLFPRGKWATIQALQERARRC